MHKSQECLSAVLSMHRIVPRKDQCVCVCELDYSNRIVILNAPNQRASCVQMCTSWLVVGIGQLEPWSVLVRCAAHHRVPPICALIAPVVYMCVRIGGGGGGQIRTCLLDIWLAVQGVSNDPSTIVLRRNLGLTHLRASLMLLSLGAVAHCCVRMDFSVLGDWSIQKGARLRVLIGCWHSPARLLLGLCIFITIHFRRISACSIICRGTAHSPSCGLMAGR